MSSVSTRGDPIRVCFPFSGIDFGGSHVSACKLIKGLDPREFTAVVALHEPDGILRPFLEEQGIPFEPVPGVRTMGASGDRTSPLVALRFAGRAASSFFGMRRFLRDNRIDIVHTNDGLTHTAWCPTARLAGVPHIWHHRGDPDARGVNMLAPLCASQIVTVSKFARPAKPIRDVTDRLSVIHSPFDQPPDQDDRDACRRMLVDLLGCPQDTRFLGYFGLLVDRKRPVGFVEAVAAQIRRRPDLPVMGLLFGSPTPTGPDLGVAAMERARELGIADRIRLMGYRSPAEPFMKAIDCLLVPAVREPFGRTLIEAMFLRTPVVATDDGGNPEATTDGVTGYLVPAETPEAFVEPVTRLLTDPAERTRIVEAARRAALDNFSVEGHVGKIARLYRKVLGRRAATA